MPAKILDAGSVCLAVVQRFSRANMSLGLWLQSLTQWNGSMPARKPCVNCQVTGVPYLLPEKVFLD